MKNSVKKVLVLGSGALKIGEAGEFDYSGSQAIKALKEEGIAVILINPNIATIQTSKDLADKVFFLPVDFHFVEKVISQEKPDGILLAFGGQTALNCGLELHRKGILKKYRVRVLGTQPEVIQKTEDRELFNRELRKISVDVPKSVSCTSVKAGLKAAEKIGYPVLTRAAFALGGMGSGFAHSARELGPLLEKAFAASPQVLIEENLKGWKEIEYEVVRDRFDNCVTVCNMENMDPMGIHTGESIVVAPSQTLSNNEYHKLREIAIRTVRHLGVIGECNIQYALDPKSDRYRVIEVNARLSRSSALASKATGYPLAHVAAKLALGYSLPELKNAVTKVTTACFEPALDYLALKIPRWDLDKFQKVSHEISSEMKSVGEIMALGRSFEEVMQKGLRMLHVGLRGFTGNERLRVKSEHLKKELEVPTPKRILALCEAFRKGWATRKIAKLTGIDPWFLEKLRNIVSVEKKLSGNKAVLRRSHDDYARELMIEAKRAGFSDDQIGDLIGKRELEVRSLRKKLGVNPVVKQIDTMAGEYPTNTNYLYMTYHGSEHDIAFAKTSRGGKKSIIVLGGGPYCIGSSVEFDWCCVNALQTCGRAGYKTIMINYNPETVSTDYDICDTLYFDELSVERVLDIYELEKPYGVIISTGGQIPNNLAVKLFGEKVHILGTSAASIDRCEDRHKFSAMLDELAIDQPKWQELRRIDGVARFAKNAGYPILVRPSYVLSGAAMSVAHTEKQLKAYLGKAVGLASDAPVVASKFETGAKEIEIDAVAYKGDLLIWAISEHVENAGVHSGDATIVLPPQKLYLETIRRVREITKKISRELSITGPFNIQFLAKNNRVMVIECNLRASRSFPFASKVTGFDFIELAAKAMLGLIPPKDKRPRYNTLDLDYVGVKAPQFSFSRLKGADPVLGVEMASTGEVACFGDDVHEAFLKAYISVGFTLPKKNVALSIGREEDKLDLLPTARKLHKLGYRLYATEGTSDFLKKNGIPNTTLYKISTERTPNLVSYLGQKKLDMVINIPRNYSREEVTAGYQIRRKAIDMHVPLVTNVQVAEMIVEALARYKTGDLAIKDWSAYV